MANVKSVTGITENQVRSETIGNDVQEEIQEEDHTRQIWGRDKEGMPRLQLERREGDKSVLEQIVNFGTNRIPNTYSIVRIEQTKYRVISLNIFCSRNF